MKRDNARRLIFGIALCATLILLQGCVVPVPIPVSVSWIESVKLHNNPNAKDVPWSELKAFLANDKTDEQQYSSTFVCADFALTLHESAENAGIKAAVVAVEFENDSTGHALDAFRTTDKGLVYIDDTRPRSFPCSADTTVSLEVGKEYSSQLVFPCPGYSSTMSLSGNLGNVKDIKIRW